MAHPTDYRPDYKILAWPADDTSGAGTEIVIGSGDFTDSMEELIGELEFEIPVAVDDLPDDWADFSTELLQRGTWIKLVVSEDGFASGSYNQDKFWGSITEVELNRDAKPALITVKCLDPLMVARGQGVNLSLTTNMLVMEATWQHDGAEWVDNFTVNIPTGGTGGLDEWVPRAIVSLVAYKDQVGVEPAPYEYDRSEYEYASGQKQIMFRNSQADRRDPAHDDFCDQWKIRLYYYDPADTTSTVKIALETIFTGDPYSDDGGLGFVIGDVDMKPIMGFDAYGITSDAYGYWYEYGTEKQVGVLLREKVDGPFSQMLDEMRDAGLLPLDYRIFYDAAAKKVRGRYVLQDASALKEPYFTVIADHESITAEQMIGSCEVYAEDMTLKDFAVGATITAQTPTLDPGGTSYTLLGSTANLVDGRPDTFMQHSLTNYNIASQKQQSTPDNYLVFDLGQVEKVKRIQLTVCPIMKTLTEQHRIYLVSWLPKVTISGSVDAITAASPGIPVSANAINLQMDIQNAGSNGGLDIDVECDWIYLMRYVCIRFEQDAFARTSDGTWKVYRTSQYGLSAVKILGDGMMRYLTGPDLGRVPFAQLTNQDGTLLAVDVPSKGLKLSVAEAAAFTAGDRIAIHDTSGAQPFGDGTGVWTDTIDSIDYGTGWITMDNALPTEDFDGTAATPTLGDHIGHYKRWMLDLTATWQDFYYPKLYQKVANTFKWLEILNTEEPGDVSEAEGLAVERLLTLITIHRDHSYVCTLDLDLKVGGTTRVPSETEEWNINRVVYHLNPRGSEARVQMTVEGTNYDEVPQ